MTKRVLVAMSGGIDSSVSAALLIEEGWEAAGVFMRHGVAPSPAGRPGKQGCCSLDDAWDARATAAGTWKVSLRFAHRGKRRSADWDFRKSTREITARNRLAAQLGWWPPDPEPEPEPEEEDESAEEPSKPSASRRRR